MGRPLPPGDYYALVSRAEGASRIRRLRLDDPRSAPTIPIPLLPPDAGRDAGLAAVFATAYERGRYAPLIDYASLTLDREEARRPRLGRGHRQGRATIAARRLTCLRGASYDEGRLIGPVERAAPTGMRKGEHVPLSGIPTSFSSTRIHTGCRAMQRERWEWCDARSLGRDGGGFRPRSDRRGSLRGGGRPARPDGGPRRRPATGSRPSWPRRPTPRATACRSSTPARSSAWRRSRSRPCGRSGTTRSRECWGLMAAGEVKAVVSAGNTGAMVASALFNAKMFLPGVRRPGHRRDLPVAPGPDRHHRRRRQHERQGRRPLPIRHHGRDLRRGDPGRDRRPRSAC